MLKQYSTKELNYLYNQAREKWIKIKKFVEKNKDNTDFIKSLEKVTLTNKLKGYMFKVTDIYIFLTDTSDIGQVIQNRIGWGKDGNIKQFILIIPTIIKQNRKDFDEGKTNVLQMFYDQYMNRLTESLYIHELIHYFQIKNYYNYESIQKINYTGYNHKDKYDEKADYFNNELEAPVYALQLVWDYKHNKQVKEIIDRYKDRINLEELEPLYKEFVTIDYKCLDSLWSQALYHMSPEVTIYVLNILNRMI